MSETPSVFAQAPEPQTPLARYRTLAPAAGVRVSPLCLGTMNFGDAWKGFMGTCDKSTVFSILDYFFESGGNFIDTANNYQDQESELWLGEWMEKRNNRDQMVIATKYTTNYRHADSNAKIHANFTGNNAKSLHMSVRDSLAKLKTDYIDILYLHWWDYTTSVPEIMQALHRVVLSGQVLYLGVSDTPAWIVSKANQYARDHGLTPFVIYQGMWSAAARDMEEEIIPMCRADGMAVAPWGALGGGKFRSQEQWENDTERRRLGDASESEIRMSKVLETIAKRHDTAITSVALAYVMHTAPEVYPIVGGRKLEHLKGNIEALKLRLTDAEIKEIRAASDFKLRFPTNFLFAGDWDPNHRPANQSVLTSSEIYLDTVPARQPILPSGS